MKRGEEYIYPQGVYAESKLMQLLGGHYRSAFWSELQRHKSPDEMTGIITDLERKLEEAGNNEEAKANIRKALR